MLIIWRKIPKHAYFWLGCAQLFQADRLHYSCSPLTWFVLQCMAPKAISRQSSAYISNQQIICPEHISATPTTFWRFWPRFMFMVQDHVVLDIWFWTIRVLWSWTIHNLKNRINKSWSIFNLEYSSRLLTVQDHKVLMDQDHCPGP